MKSMFPDGKCLHVAYASDERYLKYISVAIGSVFLWASDRTRVVVDVLALDITEERWREWEAYVQGHLPPDCRIVRHAVDKERLSQGFRLWHGSLANYARLLLPEILVDVDWVVYADVDTLFTDDPLKLLEVFDPSCSIMGHLEYPFKPLNEQEIFFRNIGLPFDKELYFCSGFILMNLNWFREHDAGKQALDFLMKHPDAPLADQEALNYVCLGSSKALPFEWGCFACEAFANGRPGAIHYPGHNPWTFMNNMFPDYIDAYNIWFQYAKFIYGKGYTFYSGEKHIVKYVYMRLLGLSGRAANILFSALNYWDFPFFGRYVKRHYASLGVWREMLSCIRGRKDWKHNTEYPAHRYEDGMF